MWATARYDNTSASEAESFRDADHELTDHPIPREPPASPADSESPAVESPAVEAEHRSEIERLLFQVMPGKLENMDEMLEQFSGQEEELIVTLNTMNEATLSTANERQWASSSGRTSASGSGREGSGGAAVAELGALGSSAAPGGRMQARTSAPTGRATLSSPRTIPLLSIPIAAPEQSIASTCRL